MKIGDAIQNRKTKEFGLVFKKHTPQPNQKPFVHVLNSNGILARWYYHNCEVINESR